MREKETLGSRRSLLVVGCAVVAFLLSWSVSATPAQPAQIKYRIAIIPKIIGIDYYDAVKLGIDEASDELPQVEVIWEGPRQDRVEEQIAIVESLIPKRPDLIAIAANDPVRIVPVLEKAKAAGIHVMSWDGDTNFREFFVNLVDYDEFGIQLTEALVEQVGPEADIAIVTTTFTAPNQVRWIKAIRAHIDAKYPKLRVLDIVPATESTERSYRIGRQFLREFPSLRGIIVLGVPNVPGVARAVKDTRKKGQVAIVGNTTPNLIRSYIKEGYVEKVHLWKAPDHGYLTVYCAFRLLSGELASTESFDAGRLGQIKPRKDNLNMQVSLPIIVLNKANIDDYEF